jgi:hypothetical protein
MIKVNLEFNDDSAVADWNAKQQYLDDLAIAKECARKGMVFTFSISTSIQFQLIRVGIVKGDIEPLTFKWKGKEIAINHQGQVSEWPEGFFDELMNITKFLIGWSNNS